METISLFAPYLGAGIVLIFIIVLFRKKILTPCTAQEKNIISRIGEQIPGWNIEKSGNALVGTLTYHGGCYVFECIDGFLVLFNRNENDSVEYEIVSISDQCRIETWIEKGCPLERIHTTNIVIAQ